MNVHALVPSPLGDLRLVADGTAVRGDGSLTGFAGGPERKQLLLEEPDEAEAERLF